MTNEPRARRIVIPPYALLGSCLTLLSVAALLIDFIVAAPIALIGMIVGIIGLRGRTERRSWYRTILIVCAIVLVASVAGDLLLLAVGQSSGTSHSPGA
jgi:hypothetical protein